MSTFSDKAVELLDLIEDIDYGKLGLLRDRNTIEFDIWYCDAGHAGPEQETNARALIERLLGSAYTVVRHPKVGHTWFLGSWNDMTVEIRTSPPAFVHDRTGERQLDRFEWTDDLEPVKP